MRNYVKIAAGRLADDLTVQIYETTKLFPREEIHGLTSQLRRAAYSVPANIVEGSSRETKRHRLGYLGDADHVRLQEMSREAFACLHGLIKAVGKEAALIARASAAATRVLAFLLIRMLPGTSVQ